MPGWCGTTAWYFLGFVVDTEPDTLLEVEAESGIDLGLSAFAVLSDGRKIDSPRFLRRAETELKRLGRELSRKATCGGCGTVHDRDHNAARNVLFEGRRVVAGRGRR
ncbi:transposase [Streptomyces sp. NPDC050164]|uniref:transposase n=1 Tax=Streptomyces sp. NPDC050164 TaxID=3365605 RepID=UPI0037A2F254